MVLRWWGSVGAVEVLIDHQARPPAAVGRSAEHRETRGARARIMSLATILSLVNGTRVLHDLPHFLSEVLSHPAVYESQGECQHSFAELSDVLLRRTRPEEEVVCKKGVKQISLWRALGATG